MIPDDAWHAAAAWQRNEDALKTYIGCLLAV
jgi:hypothetical protein